MQMPQLQISQQSARISLQSTQGTITMRQPHADMQISQTPADVNISSRQGKLHIDQSQAFEEAGLKHVFTMIAEDAQKGKKQAMQATARIARDGDRLKDIHIKSDPFVEFAKRGRGRSPVTGIDFIPSYGSVKISYQPSEANFQVQPHDVTTNVQVNRPQIQYNAGQANAYLTQKNKIHFNVVGDTFTQGL